MEMYISDFFQCIYRSSQCHAIQSLFIHRLRTDEIDNRSGGQFVFLHCRVLEVRPANLPLTAKVLAFAWLSSSGA